MRASGTGCVVKDVVGSIFSYRAGVKGTGCGILTLIQDGSDCSVGDRKCAGNTRGGCRI